MSIYTSSIANDSARRLSQSLGSGYAGDMWVQFMSESLQHTVNDRYGWFTFTSSSEALHRLGFAHVDLPFTFSEFLDTTGRFKLTNRTVRGGITDVKLSMKGRQSNRRHPSQKMRQFVLRRDDSQCKQCRTTKNLSIDHIIPWSLGGPTTPSNLQVLCTPCNSSKGNRI